MPTNATSYTPSPEEILALAAKNPTIRNTYITANKQGQPVGYTINPPAPSIAPVVPTTPVAPIVAPVVKKPEAITVDSMKLPEVPIVVPPPPADNTNHLAAVVNGQAQIDALNAQLVQSLKDKATAEAVNASANPSLDALFNKYMNKNAPPSSTAGIYAEATNAAGIDTKTQAVNDAQKQLDLLNAQLAGLNAEANAVPIQMQQMAEGRGITAGGLAPLQASKLREIALKTLPVQAQSLVQQAILTGNQNVLKTAQDKVDTLFKLKSQDATNLYNYNKEMRTNVYNYATTQEKAKLDAQQKADDAKMEQTKTNIATLNDWAKQAITNGQSNLITELSQINPSDPNFTRLLGVVTAKIEATKAATPDITEYNLAVKQGYKGTLLNWQTQQANLKQKSASQPPSSYQEWNLAGGEAGTGKTYAEFIAGKSTPTPEEKIVTDFQSALVEWDKTGTREQLIRELQAQYPQIDPNDIAKKVYETYPDNFDQ